MNRRFTCYASVVSEIHQSDIYLTVKARLLETPRANLNGVRVTAAFVDEIVNNQSDYVGLPLCADVKNLANGNYQHLGHLYDARTGEFHSAQIGSFYQFEKEDTADGAALIGYARIMKRNKAVCKAISELFAEGSLKFSFEISCGSYRELDDGTIEIDAAENNFLEGAAVVSFPACENAVALDLVAECNLLADDTRKGEDEMNQETVKEVIASEEEIASENVEETEAVVAEEAGSAPVEEVAEVTDTPAEAVDAEASVVSAEADDAEDVNAEVVVVERHVSIDDVEVCDTDDGSSVEEHTVKETRIVTPINAQNEQETVEAAAEDSQQNAGTEEDDDRDDDDDDKCAETKTAEEHVDYGAIIAELKSVIEDLRKEIAEMKEVPAHVVAESAVSLIAETANPFVSSDTGVKSKYSLLDSVEEGLNSYSLLDRA